MTAFNDTCSLAPVTLSPPRTETGFSDLQLAVMRVLWDRGESSVADVHRALRRTRPLGVTTVATLLGRLEKRGVLTHRTEGRTFLYRTTVSELHVRRRMLSGIVRNLFRGSPGEIVQQLLAERDVSHGDIERISELVEDARRSRAGKAGGRTKRGD